MPEPTLVIFPPAATTDMDADVDVDTLASNADFGMAATVSDSSIAYLL